MVAACGGRIDGIFFFGGLLVGTVLFANAYDWIQPLLGAAPGPESQTLEQLLHVPGWIILATLAAMAFIVGRLTRLKSSATPLASKRPATVGL